MKKASRKGTPVAVDDFMAELEHPFKEEVQAVRSIILSVNKNITEEIKWKAPSFSYKGYMATFNLWAKENVHLIFHNGAIIKDNSGILTTFYKGIDQKYSDRRMAYFSSMKDIRSKRPALENVVKQWIRLMDKEDQPARSG